MPKYSTKIMPAFPVPVGPDNTLSELSGMTLRDYFAGQAMVVLAMKNIKASDESAAELAYQFADAMLDEREKRMGPS